MNGIQNEILIPALTFLSVVAIGSSVIVSRQQKRRMLAQRLQEAIWTGKARKTSKKRAGFLQFLERIGNFASHGHASASL